MAFAQGSFHGADEHNRPPLIGRPVCRYEATNAPPGREDGGFTRVTQRHRLRSNEEPPEQR